MNTIIIKHIKLSITEAALNELRLRTKSARECAYVDTCEQCIHSACASYADNAALESTKEQEK